MSERKYHITYHVEHHAEGLTKDEILEMQKERDIGACDNIILMSIIGTPGEPGPLSLMPVSMKGGGDEDAELTADQMWTIWMTWGCGMADDPDLSPNRRELCHVVRETVRAALGIIDSGCGCVMDSEESEACPKCGSTELFTNDIYPPIYNCVRCKHSWGGPNG